jgi:SPP1 family predicted phage head-tail adaptor
MKQENINSGNFTEKIIWMQPTAVKDSFGQTKRTFSEYKTDFVQVDTLKAEERPMAQRIQYTKTISITTFYDSIINTKYQVTYENETYNILEIEPLNYKAFMRVVAIKLED